MDLDLITNILFAMVRIGTPLLLVALGELICEKSGILNLGQEGMMLMGAVLGFIAAATSGSLFIGVVTGMLGGVVMSLIFGVAVQILNANQVATGLALTIFGTGLSAFIGHPYVGKSIEGFAPINIPLLQSIPFIGRPLFTHDILVYFTFVLFFAICWFVYKSRAGLKLKAVGENPHAARSIGLPVIRIRFMAIAFGGAMAGLAGAYLSLAYTPLWAENMTAGRGWIALALVVFATWRPERALIGAWLFGLASILHLVFQGLGFAMSPSLLAMLPYLVTIVVLVLLSRDPVKQKLFTPASLGKPFRAGDSG